MSTDQNSNPDRTCFIVMPITTSETYIEKLADSEHFAHVLAHLFVPALKAAGLTPIEPITSGSELIHAEIIRNLEQADLVLCDLSGLNPNVFFELGIRTSLDRPVILVRDDLTKAIPFDLAAISMLTYDSSLTPWSLTSEVPRLVAHIEKVAGSINFGNPMWRYFGLTKRGEPSQAGENPIEAKLDLLIREASKFGSSSVYDMENTRPHGTLSSSSVAKFQAKLLDLLGEDALDGYRLMADFDFERREPGFRLELPSELFEGLTRITVSEIYKSALTNGINLIAVSSGAGFERTVYTDPQTGELRRRDPGTEFGRN